jgi:hypothetical protein
VKLGIWANKLFSMYGIWTPSSWTFDLNCNFLSGKRTIKSELLLSVNYDSWLYLVGSSWVSWASISATDETPVLSKPPFVSAVCTSSNGLSKLSLPGKRKYEPSVFEIRSDGCSHQLTRRCHAPPHLVRLGEHWVARNSEICAHQRIVPG